MRRLRLVPVLLGLTACTAAPAAAPVAAPHGRYVEARTASVYAGPCHANGEYTTAGRGALLAWKIEGGAEQGVDLADLSIVAVVVAGENLAEPGIPRRSLVYLPGSAAPEVQDAAKAWLERAHGDALGEIQDVALADVSVRLDGDRFAVRAGPAVELDGQALPDRRCCAMPSDVWYEPLAAVEGRVVAFTERFAFHDSRLGSTWTRSEENSAFVARF
jgi:hypothetical protein